MQRMHWLVGLALLAGSSMSVGCGSSDPTGAAVSATSVGDEKPAQPVRDSRDPRQVISAFLEFKQQGNHVEADKLLSQKAREVISKAQLPMLETPTGSDVKCEVAEAQRVEDHAARVLTIWTAGAGPTLVRLDIRWLMRNEPEGWRIVGAYGALDPTSAQEGAIDFENEVEVKEFQRRLQAHSAPIQNGDRSTATPPETAAKPSPRAKETTKQ